MTDFTMHKTSEGFIAYTYINKPLECSGEGSTEIEAFEILLNHLKMQLFDVNHAIDIVNKKLIWHKELQEQKMFNEVKSWFDKEYPNGLSLNKLCVGNVEKSLYGCKECTEDCCVDAMTKLRMEVAGDFLHNNPSFEQKYADTTVADNYGGVECFVMDKLLELIGWEEV